MTLALLVAAGLLLAPTTSPPASAATSNVTCNGGYLATGPMGTFTYKFSADVRWATGLGINHDVTMVMTYSADGYRAHSTHHQNNGFINFTVTGTDPALVDGVDIVDEFFIDGVSQGSMFTHPSCRTYAQPPPTAPPTQDPVATRAPGKVSGVKAKVLGKKRRKTVRLTWRTPKDHGSAITKYEVTGSKKTTTRKTKAVFKKLKPGKYKFRVAAVNRHGKGAASKVVKVRVR